MSKRLVKKPDRIVNIVISCVNELSRLLGQFFSFLSRRMLVFNWKFVLEVKWVFDCLGNRKWIFEIYFIDGRRVLRKDYPNRVFRFIREFCQFFFKSLALEVSKFFPILKFKYEEYRKNLLSEKENASKFKLLNYLNISKTKNSAAVLPSLETIFNGPSSITCNMFCPRSCFSKNNS